MAEEMEEDLFADLYDGDESAANNAANTAVSAQPSAPEMMAPTDDEPGYGEEPETALAPTSYDDDQGADVANGTHGLGELGQEHAIGEVTKQEPEPFQLKEDGKMFIGGLNWETTDQSLHDYFSQFGEVHECTVMRDATTGRSRGFGFLTFKDPKTVNTVMVKEHFLDGKIIDPKRAIPRDEQEKTSKIFVGGVSQDATESDFTSFFAQFGRVVDATLMMDKDTGRPRGFGFVTFDSEAAVEKVLDYHPLEILGKPIEVKKAQPRGKIGEEEDFNRNSRGRGKFGRDNQYGNDNGQNQQNQGGMAGAGGMTPQMMAQYWQRMQQYFAMMQQQMAANAMGGMGMNPQMMAQMQQMQMQQMQNMQGGKSPQDGGNMQGMNPQMQQQMMQMMSMQNGMGMGNGRGQMGAGGQGNGFSAQEQLAFEQQKYEQQARRGNQGGRGGNFNNQNQGGPQSWEGMYDDVPQPDGGSNAGRPVRNSTPSGSRSKGQTPQPHNAPANAPTGPKNAGKPGSNFRGGRGNRFHPYGR